MLEHSGKHIKTSMVKMSKKHGDWGFRTLCGLKFSRGHDKLTSAVRWAGCAECLAGVLEKREREVEYLKWAVNDLRETGYRRFRLGDMNMGGMLKNY